MPSEIQAVLFDKDYWNIIGSHHWLINHRIYPIKSPDITENKIHYRITNPSKYNRLRTKKLSHGIEFTFGFK